VQEQNDRVLAVKVSTLLRAAEILGGIEQLSAYLSVPRSELLAWLGGYREPTTASFLLAVDVVLEDSETYGVNGRGKLQKGGS
jgi:hypothetical protein